MKSLLLLLCIALLPAAHDFHASITHLHANEQSGRLEISVKLFTDDLENALQPAHPSPLRLGTDREHAAADSLISRYILQHLAVKADGRALSLRFVGKEQEADATWCHLESAPAWPFKALSVRNTLLFTLFDDQVNIMHLKTGNSTKAAMASKGSPEAVFKP